MEKNYLNESGLTLVEIIVSIAILSIVLVTFFSFFIQSTKYTEFNKEKLTAIQVAESVVADIRNIVNVTELESNYEIVDDKYVDSMSYPPFIVEIQIVPSPISNLQEAIITINKNEEASKEEFFTTQMYFGEGVK